jgi:hypothetical protein
MKKTFLILLDQIFLLVMTVLLFAATYPLFNKIFDSEAKKHLRPLANGTVELRATDLDPVMHDIKIYMVIAAYALFVLSGLIYYSFVQEHLWKKSGESSPYRVAMSAMTATFVALFGVGFSLWRLGVL